MYIKSSKNTEIINQFYTISDSINGVPTIEVDNIEIKKEHGDKIIMSSKRTKDKFIMVIKEEKSDGDIVYTSMSGVHSFVYDMSFSRIYETKTQYFALESILEYVFANTGYTYKVDPNATFYSLKFDNFGNSDRLSLINQICDRWNIEYQVNGKHVHFANRIGVDKNSQLRYKMNINDTQVSLDMSKGATYIRGFFGDKDKGTYKEVEYLHPLAEEYGVLHTEPYSNESITQESTMREYLKREIEDTWSLSIKIDVADIDGKNGEDISVGDTVWAIDERYDIKMQTRIIDMTRYYDNNDNLIKTTVVLGNKTFADLIVSQMLDQSDAMKKVAATNKNIEQLRAEFDNGFNAIEVKFAEDVAAAEQRAIDEAIALDAKLAVDMQEQKDLLQAEINASYDAAVTEAETKAKALDESISQMVINNKAATDKTISELDAALNATSGKVDTVEQNITTAQQSISTLTSKTDTQQGAISAAQQDIQNLSATVDGHTTSISNIDNQIKLTATKTEVTDAINNIEIGGVNLIRNSKKWVDAGTDNITIGGMPYRWINYSWGNNYNVTDVMKKGETYTISVMAANTTTSTAKSYILIQRKPSDGTSAIAKYIYTDFAAEENKKIVSTFIDDFEKEGTTTIYLLTTNGSANLYYSYPQLENGTKATPYDISPLDRDALITQNSSAIIVANDEITKRVTKTEFNTKTGQIEQTANTAKTTADSNTQTIATVKGNVDALSQWKADKGTAIDQTINSVTNKAWLTDINPITKRVETAEASITVNTNEIARRVTKTEFDSTTGRIEGVANTAKSTAASNTQAITTVSGRVGTLEQWRTDKGTAIDQTINAVSTKVWQNDIDKLSIGTTNLLYNSAIRTASNVTGTTKELIVGAWAFRSVYGSWVQEKLLPNTEYTISYEVEILSKPEGTNNSSIYGSAYLYSTNTPSSRVWMAQVSADFYNKGQVGDRLFVRNTFTTPLEIALDTEIIFYNTYVTDSNGNRIYSEVKFRDIMIVKGNKIGSYQPAPEDAENRMTEIKQTADGALTKATTIGNDYVKQSAVLVQSDGVLIGSKKVSGAEMASAISVTPSSVDIITKAMRITGDMAVAGDIKSLSIQAVNADIANLRAKILTADSVTATALKADTALINKLNTNALLTNYLTANTAMISAIKSNSISAVRGDIAWLKSNIITADSISSTNIKSDLALVNKIFAQDAHISALTSKSAFIRDINAISVTANSVLINSVKGELGKPNSGLNITRPDGATWIENGIGRNEMVVTGCFPRFTSSSESAGSPTDGATVFPIAEWFVTNRTMLGSGYARIDALYFNHDYRYLVLPFAVRVNKVGVYVKVEEFGTSTGATPFSAFKLFTTSSHGGGGTKYDSFVIDLGTPTFKRRQFYLYMRPNGEGKDSDLAYARFLPFKLNG